MSEENVRKDESGGVTIFGSHSWNDFQTQLGAADTLMRELSLKHRLRFLSNIRGEWPARRLRRRRFFKTYELRLMLNPAFLQDQSIHYELREHVMIDLAELYVKQLRHRLIAKYTSDEVQVAERLARDIDGILKEWGTKRDVADVAELRKEKRE